MGNHHTAAWVPFQVDSLKTAGHNLCSAVRATLCISHSHITMRNEDLSGGSVVRKRGHVELHNLQATHARTWSGQRRRIARFCYSVEQTSCLTGGRDTEGFKFIHARVWTSGSVCKRHFKSVDVSVSFHDLKCDLIFCFPDMIKLNVFGFNSIRCPV